MHFRSWSIKFFLAVLVPAGSCFAQEEACSDIKIWTRKGGDYRDGSDIPRLHEVTLPVANLKTKSRTLYDAQYQGKKTFQAISLAEILAKYDHSSGANLALLHFRNKMIVPILLDDLSQLDDKVFLVVSLKVGKTWSQDFPEIQRPDPMWRDPRPIRFCSHKMVVTKPLAFRLAGQNMTPKAFTPWRYVDTLVGIEFADSAAYYAQFDVAKSPQSRAGFQVFKNRCQFCHGAQQVGAGMGWDYAGPVPAFEKRQPDSLLLHIKYEKIEQFRLGTIMPPQSDITEREAKDLWKWLRDIATTHVRPYTP